MKISENRKCEVHATKIESLEKNVSKFEQQFEKFKDKYNSEMSEIKERVGETENQHARYQQMFSNFDDKFAHLEGTLENLTEEVKKIGNILTAVETRSDLQDENIKSKLSNNASFADKLLDTNNRAFLIIIVVLAAAVLLLLGVNAEDVAKIIKPL